MNDFAIKNLYSKLRDKAFSAPTHGDLFYNFYIFQYPACDEYKIRKQILEITNQLAKPADYLDTLVLNIFDEFCQFLDNTSFGPNPSYLQYLLSKEDKGEAAIKQVQKSLTERANSDDFIQYLHRRISQYIDQQAEDSKRPYIFIYGLGQMFPYLRTNVLLTKYEPLNKSNAYKIIAFYPGTSTDDGTKFKLFGLLNDEHTYRARLLSVEEL